MEKKMGDGGKGSAPRPFSVSNEEYAKRWDAIFARDLEAEDSAFQDIVDINVKQGIMNVSNYNKKD